MSVAIIGSGVEVFCCAHRLLDINPNLDVHIFDEKAESGMYGEEPGIFEKWPLTPSLWFGEMFSQTPTSESSAVRYSWFVKSLSIALAKRGTTLHLKSRVKKIENNYLKLISSELIFSNSGEAIIIDKKYTKIQLDTLNSMQSAVGLYKSLGFVETDQYYNNPHPEVVFFELTLD